MKKNIKNLVFITFIFIHPLVWSIDCHDLIKKGEISYKKDTEIPFTGKVTGFCFSKFSGKYIGGKCEGRCKAYYPKIGNSNEKVFQDNFFKNGKADGTQKYYHLEGNLMHRDNWENGLLNGPAETWDYDGFQTWKAIYENGKCTKALVGSCPPD